MDLDRAKARAAREYLAKPVPRPKFACSWTGKGSPSLLWGIGRKASLPPEELQRFPNRKHQSIRVRTLGPILVDRV